MKKRLRTTGIDLICRNLSGNGLGQLGEYHHREAGRQGPAILAEGTFGPGRLALPLQSEALDACDVPVTAYALDKIAWTGDPAVRAMLTLSAG